jgi:Leucine-rich repeat (LRR) protein
MKKLILFAVALSLFSCLLNNGKDDKVDSKIEPCEDFTCDSLTVRAVLDNIGLNGVTVNAVSESWDGRIKSLNLEGRQITTLPPEIGKLSALAGLYLNINQLTALPPEIGQLTSLQDVILDSNQLTSLPPEIGQLTNLQFLYLAYNQLTSLPPEIGQLTAMLDLHLRHNQLTNLPPEIGQLTVLEFLYLNNNQLTSLPPEIVNISGQFFQVIDVSGNHLCLLPDSIANWIDVHSPGSNWRETQDCP